LRILQVKEQRGVIRGQKLLPEMDVMLLHWGITQIGVKLYGKDLNPL
jgi:hypothetical protein